jgi:hypothetical protein
MTSIVRLWTQTAFDGAYLCGGWASARLVDQASAGFAGGARRTTRRRMLLAGLGAGLQGLPRSAAVSVEIDPREAAIIAAILSGAAPGPEDDLDLWAPILTACQGRRVTVAAAANGADTPSAFVAAWAELSRDKAKMKGPFIAPIPKGNVARVAWPR